MILIISSEEDQSTNDVIDWLRRYNCKYLRLSADSDFSILEIDISDTKNISFKLKSKTY
jgi:hypothetical protein